MKPYENFFFIKIEFVVKSKVEHGVLTNQLESIRMNILKLNYDSYFLSMLLKLKVDLVMDKVKNMLNFIKFNINVIINHLIGLLIVVKQQTKQ